MLLQARIYIHSSIIFYKGLIPLIKFSLLPFILFLFIYIFCFSESETEAVFEKYRPTRVLHLAAQALILKNIKNVGKSKKKSKGDVIKRSSHEIAG